MTQNQITLALMGWVPMRGTLHHALWHPWSGNVVRPIGGGAPLQGPITLLANDLINGGYLWSSPTKLSEQEIEWDQWPDGFEALEQEVLANGGNPMASGDFTIRGWVKGTTA